MKLKKLIFLQQFVQLWGNYNAFKAIILIINAYKAKTTKKTSCMNNSKKHTFLIYYLNLEVQNGTRRVEVAQYPFSILKLCIT